MAFCVTAVFDTISFFLNGTAVFDDVANFFWTEVRFFHLFPFPVGDPRYSGGGTRLLWERSGAT
jgi:hypothetical protein